MADPRDDFERRILRERTRSAAEPVVSTGLVVADAIDFVVGERRHALELDVLRTVASGRTLTPIPRAPPLVAGLTLLEGRIVPVFELAVLLDLPVRHDSEKAEVLFVGRGRTELGLRVERIGALVALGDWRRFAPGSSAPIRTEWVLGLGPDGVPVLDGLGLLESDRLYVDVVLPEQPGPLRPREMP